VAVTAEVVGKRKGILGNQQVTSQLVHQAPQDSWDQH